MSVLEIEGNFRCTRCGKKEAMTATLVLPSAAERVKMTLRHLVTIKNVKVPV